MRLPRNQGSARTAAATWAREAKVPAGLAGLARTWSRDSAWRLAVAIFAVGMAHYLITRPDLFHTAPLAVTAAILLAWALAGRAGVARFVINGAGKIDADKLDAGDLTVRLDGPGGASARARYTASITNKGLGQVTVAGSPKCTVRGSRGGPVTCGAAK